MLDQITPLVLTYNEAPNIGRALRQLRWAREIVVVDSFSDDDTLAIVKSFPQARIVQHNFESHAAQWNFALAEPTLATEWVLALDADYILTDEMILEMTELRPSAETFGYRAQFAYCISGHRIRSGLYPPVTVLYRRRDARYLPDGHAHRLIIEGDVRNLKSPILHDDRKPMGRWFQSQQEYMALEARKILSSKHTARSASERIRRLRLVAPFAVLFYCLIWRGGIFDGWPGLFYAFQRMLAELILSLRLLEHDINSLQDQPRSITSSDDSPAPGLLPKSAIPKQQSEV